MKEEQKPGDRSAEPDRAGRVFSSPQNSDALAAPAPLLLQMATARRLLFGSFIYLVLVQIALLIWFGNGLGKVGDSHGDADALRSGEAYWKEGLASYHGLPRMLYGTRFPTNGTSPAYLDSNGLVKPIYRQGFPDRLANRDTWIYTHTPPGPNILCGVSALLFGFDPIWKLRLLPIAIGLLAVAVFFKTLGRVFGPDCGALMAAACAVIPMISVFMPTLHYEGYSFAFLLLQLGVLLRLLWEPSRHRLWHWTALFLLGLLQGYFSFDMCFVVGLAVVPLWLLRRAEGDIPPRSWLCWAVILPLAGFTISHVLHFFQVSGELGGIQPALDEFRRTATERAGFDGGPGYFGNLAEGGRFYLRIILRLQSWYFGPFMLLAMAATLPLVVSRCTQAAWTPWNKERPIGFSLAWPGPGRVLPALAGALLISMLWLIVMPQHTAGNAHLTVRHFFLLYFCMILVVFKSLSFQRQRVEVGSRRKSLK